MVAQSNIRWFSDTRLNDVTLVGGKNASLGELYSVLSGQGIRVPNGFALTAQAYRDALTAAGAWDKLHQLLDGLDKTRVDVLAKRAAEAREIVFDATGTDLCVPKIRFCNIGGEGHRELGSWPAAVRSRDGDDNSCSHTESLNCFGRFGNRPYESDH